FVVFLVMVVVMTGSGSRFAPFRRQAGSDCMDIAPDCINFRRFCRGNLNIWTQQNCRHTCGLCSPGPPQVTTVPPPVPTTVSGRDACQFYNLQFCAEQNNLIEKMDGHGMDQFTRCNLREDFLQCMEDQRNPSKTTPCPSDFTISGDINYIRNRIRNVLLNSPNSCLFP
ncbi:unnamed protein product, partial [Meganyctiphanes norvegica]